MIYILEVKEVRIQKVEDDKEQVKEGRICSRGEGGENI